MKFHKIALFLVAVMSILTLSCQHRVEEPRVIATVDDTIVVSKRVNQTFTAGEVDFTIRLDGGTFDAVSNTKSTLIVGGEDVGLTISAPVPISSGASSGRFRITGTPTKTLSGSVKMQIPASYIKGRENPVTVEAKNMYWNITDNTTPYAEISGSTSYPYWTFDKIKTTGYIQLENAYLKDVSDEMDITTWINPNSNVAPNLKFYLSIDEAQKYKDRFYIIIDGSLNDSELIYFRAMSIPTKYLGINGNYNKDRVYISKTLSVGIAEGRRTGGVSFTKGYEIKGEFNVTTPASISYEIPITLQGMTFKANAESRDVSKWFAHTVQGLSYILSPVIEGSKTATITIEGVPGDASDALIEFALDTALTSTELAEIFNYSSVIAWAFDTKGSRYNITVPSDQFAYHIYDLASFGDVALRGTSPNRAFTKTYDASGSTTDIVFGDENVIYTGALTDTKVLSFPGFTRRGYKLAGFARLSEDGTVNPDTASLAYKMGDGGNVTEDPTTHKLTLTLDDADKGKVAKLYAVWTRDEASPYFKVADTITITKEQVTAANPDDSAESDATKKANYAALKDLKMHDGTTDLADGWTQSFNFYALPGGKITDTDYYKWPVSWTSNNNPSTYGNIMDDFAISDITLTPALWNVVYAWATDTARGANVYTFTFDSSSILLAGVLGSSSSSRHSAEDPLVRINWYNAVVFANALTEWYNEVVLTDPSAEKLTVAYTTDGTAAGTPIRDAGSNTAATAILDKINSGENNVNTSDATKSGLKRVVGATGFRLPTRAEWLYAASVLPNGIPSDWEASVTTHTRAGFMYPYCQNYAYASGVDGEVSTTNTKLKDYAAYYELYKGKTDYGTQTVGKYFVADDVRTNGAKSNALGIYDMSGNVWEWNEEWYGSGAATSPDTTGSRFLSGGSWGSRASNLVVGYATSISPSARNSAYSIRFCRTLPPQTN